MSLERAREAKSRALELLQELDPTAAVGITRVDGEYGVKVNLRAPLPEGVELPPRIDGVPVRVEVTGTIRAREI